MLRTFLLALILFLLQSGVSTFPAWAIDFEAPSAIAYVDANGNPKVLAFAISQGRLVHNELSYLSVNFPQPKSSTPTPNWKWVDHGLPTGATALRGVHAITYAEGGVQRIYAFVFKTVNDKQYLAVRYWNGVQWQWADQGGPALSVRDYDRLSAVHFPGSSGAQQIYVFARKEHDQNVFNRPVQVNYWNGVVWQWADLGNAPCTSQLGTPLYATSYEVNGVHRIDVRTASTTNLCALTWNGSSWQWYSLSDPGGGGTIWPFSLSVVTYRDASAVQRLYTFLGRPFQGAPRTWWMHYWTGFSWKWATLGAPPPPNDSVNQASAITYADSSHTQRIYVFAQGNGEAPAEPKLFLQHWDGLASNWVDMGLPAGHSSVMYPHALTFTVRESGTDPLSGQQRIYVFARGSNGNLVVNIWNGSTWQWRDNGNM